MDAVFLLDFESRGRFLQHATRLLGCKYICLWSPLSHTSSIHLSSTGGWYQEEESNRPSSSSRSFASRLFESYRRSSCRSETGCVPGLAYQASFPYFELEGSDLMNLASLQVQKQFYQEAGIKMVVFMGCPSGEIELGMATSNNTSMQSNVQRVFGEDFIQQYQLREDFNQPPRVADIISPISSSSSSLWSLSVGDQSPDSPYLVLPKPNACFQQEAPPAVDRERATTVPPNEIALQAYYGRYRGGQFPASANEDALLANAMHAVISSMSPSPASPVMPQQTSQRDHQIVPHQRRYFGAAFKPYSSTLAPRFGKPSWYGQKMIKMSIDVLRRIRMNRSEALTQELRPTSNQLHHMISERRRREKLNESFHALRMLLPPGSKKDKASVLANTKNYLKSLSDQISQLKERNRALEMQLKHPAEEADSSSTESVQIHVSRSVDAESTSEAQGINLTVTIKAEFDMTDLMLSLLQCLKGMRHIHLVSANIRAGSPQTSARVSLRLQVQGGEWDEESFKEVVTGAVESVVARPAGTAAE